MKTILIRSFSVLTVLAVTLFAAGPVRAQIMGINNSSVTTNIFFDDSSHTPSFQQGSDYYSDVSGWTGTAVSLSALPPLVDPTTQDSASATVSATYSANSYAVSLNNVSLSQNSANSGLADLVDFFEVNYQVGSLGFSAPTLYPTLLVSGSILNTPGSYASVTGDIYYYDVSGSGATLLDTVNYDYLNNTPGATFNNASMNILVQNGTLTVAPNDVLEVVGSFDFEVDPAILNVETVPETSSGMLMGLAAVCGIVWRRWAAK